MPNDAILIAIDHLLLCGINPILGFIQTSKNPKSDRTLGFVYQHKGIISDMNYNGIPEQKIREALFTLNYEDQDEWVMAGMAIKHELGESGLDMWLAWSSQGSTYNQKSAMARWKSFKNGRGVTIGSLFYVAVQNGFRFDEGMTRISPEQIKKREERKKQQEQQAILDEQNEARQHQQAAAKAKQIWNMSRPVDSHEYLTKKDVCSHSIRQNNNNLVVPLYYRGEIVNVQTITPEGEKLYLKGAKKSGAYSMIGDPTDTILICEGWATGATLHEATQLYVIVALDSGNLTPVAKEIRKQYPFARIVMCADNDQYKRSNTGIKAAVKAACEIDADVVYPRFKDTTNKPTDFNDLSSFNEVYEQVVTPCMFKLECNNSVPALNAFDLAYIDDFEKVLEESTDFHKVARAALHAALRMSESYPAFVTMDMIRNYIQHPLLNHRTHLSIMRRVQWAIYNRKRIALSAVKPEKWGKHNHVVVNDLKEVVLNNGVNLIFAPMGSGKTQKIIKPFSKQEKVFCAIAHRRSLISELSDRLNVENYEEAKNVDFSDKVAVCLPSAMSTRFHQFTDRVQNLAIDEVSQNIRFTSSKECKASGVDQEGVYMGLKDLVNKSEVVIGADASIDQTTIDFFEQARPDEQFTIIEQIPNNSRERKCFLYDEEMLLSRVQAELMNEGKVWFAVESVAKAEAIYALFSENYKCILITSKNSTSKKIKDFLSHVEDESRKYDMVIASPAISSGVSVEHGTAPHFTMIAGIASGAAICFSDFAQMLARVRYVDHYHVCLKKNNHKYDGVTANTILMGQRQSALLEGGKLKENEYTQVMALIDEKERAYRADFANGFVWFLEYYCFEIMPPMPTQIDYTILDKLKEIAKENKEHYRKALCEAPLISQDEADALDAKKDITEEEQLVLMAFNIRKLLGYEFVHSLTPLDIDMFERLPAIDRFTRYLGLVPPNDDSDKNIALRKFANAQVKAIEIMLEDTKLDTALFTADLCKDIVKRVSSNQNRFLLSALKLVPSTYARDIQDKRGNLKPLNVPTNCGKAMGCIIEKFGLKWKRVTKGHSRTGIVGYQVTEESYNLMKEYSLRRHEKMIAIQKKHV